ncbi:N-acetyltransferase, partial [Burkholderia pseudomallei]
MMSAFSLTLANLDFGHEGTRMTTFPISSARLVLRAFKRGVLAAFTGYRKDRDVGRFESWAWSTGAV